MFKVFLYHFLLLPLVIGAQVISAAKVRLASDEESCNPECRLKSALCYSSDSISCLTNKFDMIHELSPLDKVAIGNTLIPASFTDDPAAASTSFIPPPHTASTVDPGVTTVSETSTVLILTTTFTIKNSTSTPPPSVFTVAPSTVLQTVTVTTEVAPATGTGSTIPISRAGAESHPRDVKLMVLGMIIAVRMLI